MIGQTIAHYQITEKIGAGGMGEVFRATDTKLGRDVAVKMLPAAFAEDAERMARFQREARVLASLNHPNIGAIYGLEEHGGSRFLVLELIEGPTLFDRLTAGRIPQLEAVGIARQIAEAVEFAHENGVVHRDLKPANVKLTEDGRVKVLDFGLAKALEDPAASSLGNAADSPTMSPTLSPTLQSPITGALTGANVILGTAAYMSPEQARGKPLDRRTDIFSFGCLFYEMLTHRRPFGGETVSDVIARILEREPDWSEIPASTPERVVRIVRRCLEKDARKRQRDMGDVRLALEEIESTWDSSTEAARAPASSAATAPASRRSAALGWGVAALVSVAAVAGFLLSGIWKSPEPPPTVRFQFTAPPDVRMLRVADHVKIAPDGSAFLWRGQDSEGRTQTWARLLNSVNSHVLPAVDWTASWSPDGRSVLFLGGNYLRTVAIEGGDPRIVCELTSYRGASWGADYIVFAEGQSCIYRVPVAGGTPEPVTTLNESRGETAHRYPHFFPDGETFLFVALPSKHRLLRVYAGHVDGREPVFITNSLISPIYCDPGYIIFQRGRRLVAQAFDADRLEVSGELIILGTAPELRDAVGAPTVSVSLNGHLAHVTPEDLNTALFWIDPETGEELEKLDLDPGIYHSPDVSPDGRHIALVRAESPEESDIWVLELERKILTRFTQGPGNHELPVWSPDGRWIAYSTDADGPWNIYRKPFRGSGPAEPVVHSPVPFKNLRDWSPDGKYLLYGALGDGTNMDIWIAPADGSGDPWPYQADTFQEESG
ncbi:MAG: serine/threonine-protein kinase, partial [Gemmatimonadetes bacterium]|nr:serine/threonine-protein kinase [Gemmatimonadota bacterium]